MVSCSLPSKDTKKIFKIWGESKDLWCEFAVGQMISTTPTKGQILTPNLRRSGDPWMLCLAYIFPNPMGYWLQSAANLQIMRDKRGNKANAWRYTPLCVLALQKRYGGIRLLSWATYPPKMSYVILVSFSNSQVSQLPGHFILPLCNILYGQEDTILIF